MRTTKLYLALPQPLTSNLHVRTPEVELGGRWVIASDGSSSFPGEHNEYISLL